jgi:hypothetical protein
MNLEELRIELWWKREHLRDFLQSKERRNEVLSRVSVKLLPRPVKYWAAIDLF